MRWFKFEGEFFPYSQIQSVRAHGDQTEIKLICGRFLRVTQPVEYTLRQLGIYPDACAAFEGGYEW